MRPFAIAASAALFVFASASAAQAANPWIDYIEAPSPVTPDDVQPLTIFGAGFGPNWVVRNIEVTASGACGTKQIGQIPKDSPVVTWSDDQTITMHIPMSSYAPGTYDFCFQVWNGGYAFSERHAFSLTVVKGHDILNPQRYIEGVKLSKQPVQTLPDTMDHMNVHKFFVKYSESPERWAEYYPTTDFLTVFEPNPDASAHAGTCFENSTTHTYLARGNSHQSGIRSELWAKGYNSIYVYTLNQGDYCASDNHPENVVTPYGNDDYVSGQPLDWAFKPQQLNADIIAAWRADLQQLINKGLKPFLWLLPDDSPGLCKKKKNPKTGLWEPRLDLLEGYIDDMVASFDDLPIIWVLGLELDTLCQGTWPAGSRAAAVHKLRERLQSKTLRPVGVHLTHTQSRVQWSVWKDGFDFVMLQFPHGKSDQTYRDYTYDYVRMDKPMIVSEYNQKRTHDEEVEESRHRGRVVATEDGCLCSSYEDGKAAGIGNGIRLNGK